MKNNKIKIAIVGVGYVGLPIALKFGEFFDTIGFDINEKKIDNLNKNIDSNNEFKKNDFKKSSNLIFSNDATSLLDRNIYIVCIPTPISKNKKPDLKLIFDSCDIIAKFLNPKDLIVFESTFYPGLTEEVLIPYLEKKTKYKNIKNNKIATNKNFYVGYSPERINPGDRNHNLENINKIISSNNSHALKIIKKIYSKVIKAKLVEVSSIKVAEAAKVIENTQRDINIALINEFSQIFKKIDVDTNEVLKAAGTKWNFLKFKPGFVGGHCIGVDPYYLSYKSIKSGYRPKIILTGREINDSMPRIVFNELINLSKKKKIKLDKCKILIFGVTFKENVSDTRNSKVLDLIEMFLKKNSNVFVYDPLVKFIDNKKINLITKMENNFYDIIIYAVNHKNFKYFTLNKINKLRKKNSIFYDLNYVFDKKAVDLRL